MQGQGTVPGQFFQEQPGKILRVLLIFFFRHILLEDVAGRPGQYGLFQLFPQHCTQAVTLLDEQTADFTPSFRAP